MSGSWSSILDLDQALSQVLALEQVLILSQVLDPVLGLFREPIFSPPWFPAGACLRVGNLCKCTFSHGSVRSKRQLPLCGHSPLEDVSEKNQKLFRILSVPSRRNARRIPKSKLLKFWYILGYYFRRLASRARQTTTRIPKLAYPKTYPTNCAYPKIVSQIVSQIIPARIPNCIPNNTNVYPKLYPK